MLTCGCIDTEPAPEICIYSSLRSPSHVCGRHMKSIYHYFGNKKQWCTLNLWSWQGFRRLPVLVPHSKVHCLTVIYTYRDSMLSSEILLWMWGLNGSIARPLWFVWQPGGRPAVGRPRWWVLMYLHAEAETTQRTTVLRSRSRKVLYILVFVFISPTHEWAPRGGGLINRYIQIYFEALGGCHGNKWLLSEPIWDTTHSTWDIVVWFWVWNVDLVHK